MTVKSLEYEIFPDKLLYVNIDDMGFYVFSPR